MIRPLQTLHIALMFLTAEAYAIQKCNSSGFFLFLAETEA